MEWLLQEKSCWVEPFGSIQTNSPLILLLADNDSSKLLSALQKILPPLIAEEKCSSFLLASFGPIDWDKDYTPWPTQDPNGRIFGGKAAVNGAFLQKYYWKSLGEMFSWHGPVYPVGYSLGGLAALYYHCMYHFAGCGSCSGSFWYPGWLDYLSKHSPQGRIYLSLGSKEKNTRHPWMCQIEDSTRYVKKLLEPTAQVTFVHEPGGHFHQIPQRIAHAIAWLLQK